MIVCCRVLRVCLLCKKCACCACVRKNVAKSGWRRFFSTNRADL